MEIAPKRSDVNVSFVALGWMPYWRITYKDGVVAKSVSIPAYTARTS
jgi:hypothetical protein